MRGALLLAALLMACGGSTKPTNEPESCGDRPTIGSECIGVSQAAICDAERCHDGASCSRIHEPSTEDDLQSVAASARPGECISIPRGKWGKLAITGGVSLLGRGASDVTVAGIAIDHATGATSLVRGIGVEGAILANGEGNLDLDRVLVTNSADVAVRVLDGSVTIRGSTIKKSARGGVYVSCVGDCVPGKRPRLVIRSSWITDAHRIGVWAVGVDADLRDVAVERVEPADFLFGRGIEASAGATLQATNVRVERTTDVGIFVSTSAGSLGPGLEVRDCQRGIHLAATTEGGVIVDGFVVENVSVSGVALAKGSRGVALRNGRIARTLLHDVPGEIGGMESVGDGLIWESGVEAEVAASVTIESSARVPALIDATASGSFSAKLVTTDATTGIVVEHAKAPSDHPALTIASGTKVVYAEEYPIGTSPAPAPKP